MPSDCLFCAIGRGSIGSDVVRQDDDVMVFRDIAAQAPVHVLAIPKRHFANVAALVEADRDLAAKLLATAASVAEELGIDGTGYRLVMNTGADGGQTVDHVHIHLLGARHLGWPPG
jgi:histidine triad (HIT) family protein